MFYQNTRVSLNPWYTHTHTEGRRVLVKLVERRPRPNQRAQGHLLKQEEGERKLCRRKPGKGVEGRKAEGRKMWVRERKKTWLTVEFWTGR